MSASITFEFHGRLLRSAGSSERRVAVNAPLSLADALNVLVQELPQLEPELARCACALGDRLLLRREALAGGERIALLPPVAGG